jgi:hypothetical protein
MQTPDHMRDIHGTPHLSDDELGTQLAKIDTLNGSYRPDGLLGFRTAVRVLLDGFNPEHEGRPIEKRDPFEAALVAEVHARIIERNSIQEVPGNG